MPKQHAEPSADGRWQNRIKGTVTVRAGDLRPHPKNFRLHPGQQREAMEGVLDEVGKTTPPLIYRSADAPGVWTVVDGHMRTDADPDEPWICIELDIDDSTAAKILATHDSVGTLATLDAARLDDLLREITTESAGVQELLAHTAALAGLYGEDGEGGAGGDPDGADGGADGDGEDGYDETEFWPEISFQAPDSLKKHWETRVKRARCTPHELLERLLGKLAN